MLVLNSTKLWHRGQTVLENSHNTWTALLYVRLQRDHKENISLCNFTLKVFTFTLLFRIILSFCCNMNITVSCNGTCTLKPQFYLLCPRHPLCLWFAHSHKCLYKKKGLAIYVAHSVFVWCVEQIRMILSCVVVDVVREKVYYSLAYDHTHTSLTSFPLFSALSPPSHCSLLFSSCHPDSLFLSLCFTYCWSSSFLPVFSHSFLSALVVHRLYFLDPVTYNCHNVNRYSNSCHFSCLFS